MLFCVADLRVRAVLQVGILLRSPVMNAFGDGEVPSFAERLELLPRSLARKAGWMLVKIADLARAAELAGAERPADASDLDAVHTYLRAVQGLGDVDAPRPEVAAVLPDLVGTAGAARADEFQAELGWSVVDVDWYVEYATPPGLLTVLGGAFDEDRLTGAMGDPENGIWRVGGPDGRYDRTHRSAARPIGQPRRLALEQGRLLVANETGTIERARGDGASFGEIADLRALAEAMDGERAYSALFNIDRNAGLRPVVTPEQLGELATYRSLATGLAHDGEPYLVLAYSHDEVGAAEINAEAIRFQIEQGVSSRDNRPWSDRLAVDTIRVDGTTMAARLALRDADPGIAREIMYNWDSLTVHR
jgi:hypothetical protein